jgi:purine-binding chemotaxis protein CheW
VPDYDFSPLERIRDKLAQIRARDQGAQPADAGALLRERARMLAQEPPAPEEGDILEVVEFRLGKERMAFEAAWVKEVFIPRSIVKVPCTPPFIAGILNLRGSILSLVDLRLVLDLPESDEEAEAALLLSDGAMEFGILAAEVESARTVFHHDIRSPLATVSEKAMRFQRGILPGAVSLLDARLLLESPQMRITPRESSY